MPRSTLWYTTQRIVALLLLLALSPALLLLGLIVKFTSAGPILFGQQRPGLGGKLFTAWKFRTMRPGSDLDPSRARAVASSDPGITAIGKILRDLKLDELPQLWNVVRGEMAFVGPRPIALPLHQELCRAIPGFSRRLEVRPGLTNLGQICIDENSDQSQVVADWKLRFEAEQHYFENRSVYYDVVIAGMTVLYILRKVLLRLKPDSKKVGPDRPTTDRPGRPKIRQQVAKPVPRAAFKNFRYGSA